MKKFILIATIGFGTLVFGDYTIQVINTQKSSSITPAFNKKIADSKMSKKVATEGSCNIVTVGNYKSSKSAKADLAKAKKIASDAFIRPVNRKLPQLCDAIVSAKQTTTSQNIKVANNTETKTEAISDKTPSITNSSTTTTIEKIATNATIEQNTQATSIAVVDGTTKKPEDFKDATRASSEAIEKLKSSSSHTATHTSVYIYDKNLARKSDMHDAIEYYKNSPYHSFRAMK